MTRERNVVFYGTKDPFFPVDFVKGSGHMVYRMPYRGKMYIFDGNDCMAYNPVGGWDVNPYYRKPKYRKDIHPLYCRETGLQTNDKSGEGNCTACAKRIELVWKNFQIEGRSFESFIEHCCKVKDWYSL